MLPSTRRRVVHDFCPMWPKCHLKIFNTSNQTLRAAYPARRGYPGGMPGGYVPGGVGVRGIRARCRGYRTPISTAAKQASHTSTSGVAPRRSARWCRSRSAVHAPPQSTHGAIVSIPALDFNQPMLMRASAMPSSLLWLLLRALRLSLSHPICRSTLYRGDGHASTPTACPLRHSSHLSISSGASNRLKTVFFSP